MSGRQKMKNKEAGVPFYLALQSTLFMYSYLLHLGYVNQ